MDVRILVVEDDKHVARAVRRGLEAEGYAVDVALTAPTASGWPRRTPTTPWSWT